MIEINIKIPVINFTYDRLQNLIEKTVTETVNAYKEVNDKNCISVEEFKRGFSSDA